MRESAACIADHEIVLTFDDGPLPPYTSRVLDILAADCIKATFFMVGRQVHGYPQLVRRAYNEGHTIANHSQNHPLTFNRMAVEQAAQEIEGGFAALRTALGERGAVAPFFRIPGLLRQPSVEGYLKSNDVMIWSVDFLADDWKHIKSKDVVKRALERIEAKGRGILLLHDIQPATAAGLPDLLKQLKSRGYRIVHVVPATPEQPATVTAPEQWVRPVPHTPRPRPVAVVRVDPAVGQHAASQSPAWRWLPMSFPQNTQYFGTFLNQPRAWVPTPQVHVAARTRERSPTPGAAAGSPGRAATVSAKTGPISKPPVPLPRGVTAPATVRAKDPKGRPGGRDGHQLSLP
jgi:peptidoglycan/xylan/chitin deacetylase (PgdA/CDA1 family)